MFRRLDLIRGACSRQTPIEARFPHLVRGPAPEECVRRLHATAPGFAGAGSVGSRLVDITARMGVGKQFISDPGSLKAESPLTHSGVRPSCDGKAKSLTAAKNSVCLNPDSEIFWTTQRWQDLSIAELVKCDLVFLAVDNLESEIEVAMNARRLGIPMIHAAVEGRTLTAQVSVYGNKEESPCPGCRYSPSEWKAYDQRIRYSCNGFDAQIPVVAEPTMSMPSLCCIAADLAIQMWIRHVLGLGEPVLDTMLTYNGYSNSLMAGRLKQNQDCPCDHRSFTRVNLDGLRKATCEQILEASGTGPERVSLEIDEHDFAQPDSCDCGRIPLTGHFIRRQSRRCPGCGKALRSSFRTHREFNPKMIGTAMSIPLRELGASSARCAIVTTPVRGVLVFEGV